MQLSTHEISDFRDMLFGQYAGHGRHELPWRIPDKTGFDPYKIVVSELMLQQTQVSRVISKYTAFTEQFPDVSALANASLGDVLIAWQGLGYNRRAKFLWQAAQQVEKDFEGAFPAALTELVSLPGIGKNTAGAVRAYAFNQPAIFIETNVRTVYIHYFFAAADRVDDKQIKGLLEQTLTLENPREFYWAVMDYGSLLKQSGNKASARSKHHVRQSPFVGSKRQVRGVVLRALATRGYTAEELAQIIPDARLSTVLIDLASEGMISSTRGIVHLS